MNIQLLLEASDLVKYRFISPLTNIVILAGAHSLHDIVLRFEPTLNRLESLKKILC